VLEEIQIRGLGVIDDAVLDLAPGLTVVTGETGAGKTMIVTGLGLLFGSRSDAGLVQPDGARAIVEGRLTVDPEGTVASRAVEAGGDLDEGALLLARTIAADGRSRAYVGGRQVPVAVLSELAESLVAVHGQGDQQRLLSPSRQREALDRYAGAVVTTPLARYQETYERLREVATTLAELTTRARARLQEADALRYGLAEIEAVKPQLDEEAALAAEWQRLSHADALRVAAETAHGALMGDPESGSTDAITLVGLSRKALEDVRSHDSELSALADRLAEAGYLLSDVAGDLASYTTKVDTDPRRLAAVQERRAALTRLTRKYGDSIEDVLAWSRTAQGRLDELGHDDERIETLRAEHAALVQELTDLAQQISNEREAAADRFATAVSAELADLAMAQAKLSVCVSQRDDARGLAVNGRTVAFGPSGVDDIELRLQAHPDAPPRPLQKGASGGELSRVMLAVEVVFAGADPVPTFVFDEVDAGIGGVAAVEVGRRLAQLARTAQVLVVTHLPQVAAFADAHLVVSKASDGSVVRSGVVALDGESRVNEVSRMLAGLADSPLARAHAQELLAAAAAAKAVVFPADSGTAKRRRRRRKDSGVATA
jgi:DNA repair protein RecN (Recombination protein N)